MTYLQPSEYSTYGLESTTPGAAVAAASSLIDSHCRRATLVVAQYVERIRIRGARNTVRLSYLPLAIVAPATSPLVAARGRYAVPRRDEGESSDFVGNILRVFALPGTWTSLDPAALDFDCATGEITLPPHPLGFAYNELELTYNGGLPAIPDAVKFACSQVVRNAQSTPALNVRAGSMDRLRLDYFAADLLDETVRRYLAPYVAQKMG
jgi:hypothetical protein